MWFFNDTLDGHSRNQRGDKLLELAELKGLGNSWWYLRMDVINICTSTVCHFVDDLDVCECLFKRVFGFYLVVFLVTAFKHFDFFHPVFLGKWSNLTIIFFRWVVQPPTSWWDPNPQLMGSKSAVDGIQIHRLSLYLSRQQSSAP